MQAKMRVSIDIFFYHFNSSFANCNIKDEIIFNWDFSGPEEEVKKMENNEGLVGIKQETFDLRNEHVNTSHYSVFL